MTPQVRARIDELRLGGRGRNEIVQALLDGGLAKSRRTAYRWVRQAAGSAEPPARYEGVPQPSPQPPPPAVPPPAPAPAPPAPEAGRIAAAIETGDVAALRELRGIVAEALGEWLSQAASNPSARLSIATYGKLMSDLTQSIVELTPRPEEERDRLIELGEAARQRLLERATGTADSNAVAARDQRIAELETRIRAFERLLEGVAA
jgi:hypothetical protein